MMPQRVKRITMYRREQFAGQEETLDRLQGRDLIGIHEEDHSISVFPAAAAEPLDEHERPIIYRLLGYSIADDETPLIIKRAALVGGRAAIAGTRTPVWHLVNSRRQGSSDADLRRHYGLSDEQLRQAFTYYDRHTEEIDRDIFDNETVYGLIGERR